MMIDLAPRIVAALALAACGGAKGPPQVAAPAAPPDRPADRDGDGFVDDDDACPDDRASPGDAASGSPGCPVAAAPAAPEPPAPAAAAGPANPMQVGLASLGVTITVDGTAWTLARRGSSGNAPDRLFHQDQLSSLVIEPFKRSCTEVVAAGSFLFDISSAVPPPEWLPRGFFRGVYPFGNSESAGMIACAERPSGNFLVYVTHVADDGREHASATFDRDVPAVLSAIAAAAGLAP